MLIEFSHFLQALFRAFLLPPADLFLFMALGWLVGRRWPRIGKTMMRTAMTLLFVLTTAVGADLLVTPLEHLTVPLALPMSRTPQAIVLLAAGRLENAPEYEQNHIPDYIALARLRYAARLQHETGLPILVSGGNRATRPPLTSKAEEIAQALRADFHTPVRWIEGRSETTGENASRSAAFLLPEGIRRILLVTDAMHMARANAEFARQGFTVIDAPTMFFGLDHWDARSLVPSAEGLRRSYYACYEWLGLAWFYIR